MQVRMIDRESIIYLVDGLEQFEKDKAIKSGLRAAVNLFRVRGRSNLRSRLNPISQRHSKPTNHLMNSFTTRVKRTKLGALAGFGVGGNHSHLVDKGTKSRPHPITGTSGAAKGNQFWTDAKKSEEPKAIDAVYKGVEKAVQRINNRR